RGPTDQGTTADQRTTTDQGTTADQRTTTDQGTTADQRTTTDQGTTADQRTTTDQGTTADQRTTAEQRTITERKITTDERTAADSTAPPPWPGLPIQEGVPSSGCPPGRPGRVTLTVPWQTLAGMSSEPGMLCWLGPVTPLVSRQIAETG